MDNKADTGSSEPIVHGDKDGGFIVEHHDGDQHFVHGVTGVDSPEAAVSSAKDKWAQDAKEKDAKAEEEGSAHAGAKGVTKAHLQEQLDNLGSGFSAKIKEIEDRSRSELSDLRDKVSDLEAKAETHARELEKLAGSAIKNAGAAMEKDAPGSSSRSATGSSATS